jgi:hypothetical protein
MFENKNCPLRQNNNKMDSLSTHQENTDDNNPSATINNHPTTPPPIIVLESRTETDFIDNDYVSWDDITIEDGKPVGVYGTTWEQCGALKLRTICSRFGIKNARVMKKTDMITMIHQSYNNKQAYVALQNRKQSKLSGAPKKEVQCSFRLMNILFSDEFVTEFASLGDVASRVSLDSGRAAYDERFWVKVQAAFVDPSSNSDYNQLCFRDNDVFAAQDHIDPSKIVQHDWKKLRTIWKGVNSEYMGTHTGDFYSFCNGKLDVFYLQWKARCFLLAKVFRHQATGEWHGQSFIT